MRPGPDAADNEALLAAAAAQLAERNGLSGVHITFLSEGEWERLGARGFLQRTDQQFHWRNAGYGTFDDFLASLASRKRKAVRKEREQAVAAGLDHRVAARARHHRSALGRLLRLLHGHRLAQVGAALSQPQVLLAARRGAVGERCLLMLAKRGGSGRSPGSLHMIGGDCLYGRYWGAVEHHPCLHFELCYYQAIEYAIQHKIARVEAGAQGEHKLARGYLPTKTYSAHYIADPCAAPRDRRLSGARARLRGCGGRGARRVRAVPQGAAGRSGLTGVERDEEIAVAARYSTGARRMAQPKISSDQQGRRDEHVAALGATQGAVACHRLCILQASAVHDIEHCCYSARSI